MTKIVVFTNVIYTVFKVNNYIFLLLSSFVLGLIYSFTALSSLFSSPVQQPAFSQ